MKIIAITLLALSFAACCDKEPDISNTDCIEIQQNPDYITEDLNQDFTIQFPTNYTGDGLVVQKFANFLKFSDKVIVKYSFLCPTDCIKFYGWSLDHPIPNSVIGSTIDATTSFDQKIEFCKNDIIEAIFYHNSDNLSFGTLYLQVEDKYLESAKIQFEKEKLEEVISILKTLKKN
ncbi:MAG TPA: hypothetical protein PLQ57_13445 [Saprospiraceae bacterium]|nr:hypothetical protein [Saprospiraceae bacterium]